MKIMTALPWTNALLLPVLIGCSIGQPTNLDQAGMAPCPDTPNCVSSQSENPKQRVAPLPFDGDVQAARERLLALIKSMPRCRVVDVQPNIVRVEFISRIFKFKDDVTFWIQEQDKVIHLRSASRSGYYDFGVNRKRAQTIARLWTNGR